ncbi:TPA: hypothetical protein P2R06_004049 [Aeromonas veronii]|nr:hypothetical protein [Aeromonas veronii]
MHHTQPSERRTSSVANDNFIDLVQISVKTIFSPFTLLHKIAKRQSTSRQGVMPAIIAIPLVKGCGLGTVTLGAVAWFLVGWRKAKRNRRFLLRQSDRDKQGCGKTVKQMYINISGKGLASIREVPTYYF